MTSVLVVDDDAQLRAAVARDLESNGFEVRAVESVKDALAALQASPVDVLLTDLRMSDEDGIDLLDQVRRACDFRPVRELPGRIDLRLSVHLAPRADGVIVFQGEAQRIQLGVTTGAGRIRPVRLHLLPKRRVRARRVLFQRRNIRRRLPAGRPQ